MNVVARMLVLALALIIAPLALANSRGPNKGVDAKGKWNGTISGKWNHTGFNHTGFNHTGFNHTHGFNHSEHGFNKTGKAFPPKATLPPHPAFALRPFNMMPMHSKTAFPPEAKHASPHMDKGANSPPGTKKHP